MTVDAVVICCGPPSLPGFSSSQRPAAALRVKPCCTSFAGPGVSILLRRSDCAWLVCQAWFYGEGGLNDLSRSPYAMIPCSNDHCQEQLDHAALAFLSWVALRRLLPNTAAVEARRLRATRFGIGVTDPRAPRAGRASGSFLHLEAEALRPKLQSVAGLEDEG